MLPSRSDPYLWKYQMHFDRSMFRCLQTPRTLRKTKSAPQVMDSYTSGEYPKLEEKWLRQLGLDPRMRNSLSDDATIVYARAPGPFASTAVRYEIGVPSRQEQMRRLSSALPAGGRPAAASR